MEVKSVGAILVETFGEVAIRRWQRMGQVAWNRPHHPEFCACLTCADGREMAGREPLIPLFARRSVTEGTL